MRSTGSSTTSSPGRRALHERTSSQTNEVSPPQSLRAVSDKHNDQEDECDVYTATPYPTKPEHILLPRPGKGQEFIPDSRFHIEEMPNESSATLSTEISHILDSSLIEQSTGDPWDLSSTFDAANTPPQVWEDDPASSKSSLPEHGPAEHREVDFKSDDVSYSDEEPNTLPRAAPTIKTVISDTSSQPPHPANAASSNSSPNVIPIGPSSSPNFVALDSSSLNFVPIGASSNPDSGSRSNSLSSMNSLGTVISQAHALTPFVQIRPIKDHQRAQIPPAHVNGVTLAIVDSGVFLQYPTIHAPSSESSRVDVSHSGDSLDHTQHETTAD
ncbi:serine-rich protein, partial [Aspergillus nomiae NRRL 13137]